MMRIRSVWLVLAISPLGGCPSGDDVTAVQPSTSDGSSGTGAPSITTVASTIDPGMTGPPPGDASSDDAGGSTSVGTTMEVSESDATTNGAPGSTTDVGDSGQTTGDGETSSGGGAGTSSSGGETASSSDDAASTTSTTSAGTTGTTGGCEPSGLGNYADCLDENGTIDTSVCANGAATCVVNDVANPFIGGCAVQNCSDACECPPHPGTGNAPVVCEDVTGDALAECWLDCSGGDSCPDGMYCYGTICLWPNMDDGAVPWADCANFDNVCGLDGICIVDNQAMTTVGVCSEPCATVVDCPAAPPTGTAPVACEQLIASSPESECILDCSSGQTCPNGMSCFAGTLCGWGVN